MLDASPLKEQNEKTNITMYYALRIIEKIFILYFSIYFLIDLGLYLYALYVFVKSRRQQKREQLDYANHPISVIVPAYNEEVSIVVCTKMLAILDYPDYELILVNDGSSDRTMDVLKEAFDLEEVLSRPLELVDTQSVKKYYKVKGEPIYILDKENGGKADAVNAGINYAKGKYICTIDADSILDSDALKYVVAPFIRNPATIVTGGQLAVANDVMLEGNKVVNSKVPRNIWVQWQIVEYIKSFMISRIGFSKINALLIMSGAFSLFKKEDLLEVGGFLSKGNQHPYIVSNLGEGKQTVCEDMEIVVRLWKYKRDQKQEAKAEFLPDPICWTEVPESPKNLYKQRMRWHQGLGETLKLHANMVFEPKYGVTGLLGLPYYMFFEFLSPIMKFLSLIFVFVAIKFGVINTYWVILLLVSMVLVTSIITSSITLVIEYWSHKHRHANRDALRYKSIWDWMWLIVSGVIGEFSYSFFKIAAQINGISNFLKKKHDWKKFDRKGIHQKSE